MLFNNIKKHLPTVFAIASAIACLVMVIFEVINMHVPALAWFAFSMCMLGYVITEYGMKKAK